jgi:hypothetical protein
MIFQFQFSKLGRAQPNSSSISLPQTHNSPIKLTQSHSLGILQIPCPSPHHNVLLRTPKSHYGATRHLLVLHGAHLILYYGAQPPKFIS